MFEVLVTRTLDGDVWMEARGVNWFALGDNLSRLPFAFVWRQTSVYKLQTAC